MDRPPSAGRACGLCRQATDLAPEFEADARVLNTLSRYTDGTTRERVYQEKQHTRVRARAAATRRKMRQFLREPEHPDREAA